MRGRIGRMQRLCLSRKVLGVCLSAGIFAAMSATAQAAQPQAKPRAGTAARQIILPAKLVAGAPATLAVLDSQGRLLPDIAVELPAGQSVTTDVTGRASFTAPAELGQMTAKVRGSAISASADIILPENPGAVPAAVTSPERVRVFSYPRVLEIHDRFTLEGVGFRGAADANHVDLNGDPCLVLASSPLSVVALPGVHAPVGDANLHIAAGGADGGQFPVSVVLLEFSGPAEAVSAGSAGKLVVHARGTEAPLTIELRNASPAVIQLAKGNLQRLKTSGGEDNAAPVDVKYLSGGNYAVTARLVSAGAPEPDLESARKCLADARKIASGDWPARIDDVLLKFDQAPRDLPRIRAELRAMLNDKPAAPLASLLDSAWRELN